MKAPDLRPETALSDGLLSVRAVQRLGMMGLTERSTIADLARVDARAEAARTPRALRPLREMRAVCVRAGIDMVNGDALTPRAPEDGPWVVRSIAKVGPQSARVTLRRGRQSISLAVSPGLAATLRVDARVKINITVQTGGRGS